MEKELLTAKGYDRLTAEIKKITLEDRTKIIEEVQTAREHGDLKENAEYHAAKEKQRLLDKKLEELNSLLADSQIIDPSKLPHDIVSFGSTVTIVDLDTEEEATYTIVGSYEADVDRDIISYNSPLAKVLLGKPVGEELEATLPGGVKEFEILSIEYRSEIFES
ncbi:transcription elongation factor [Thiovulum sp. ES]|nr:transcription elongation factor [Thiovulum sp. ES]